MNNFKKLGLTALAGSLAAVSANAGEMAVSGAAMMSYTSQDTSEVTGNPFGLKTNLAFSGSGELDNGWNVSYYMASQDQFAGQSSASLSVDMGDSGTMLFDQGTGSGLWGIRDKLPRAGEESWDSLDTSSDGFVGFGTKGKLVYSNAFADVNYSVSYMNQGAVSNSDGSASSGGDGSSWDVSGSHSPMDGLNLYAGYGQRKETTETNNNDHDVDTTVAATYAYGMVTVGAQLSSMQEGDFNGTHKKMQGFGVAVNVNDNLSISWNERETQFDKASAVDVDAKTEGLGLAYTMGSMKFTAQMNEGSNLGGVAGASDEDTELTVSFAF
jgi:outer membrane protein OmpU